MSSESGFLSVPILSPISLLLSWLPYSLVFISFYFQAARIRWETVEQPLRSQEYFSRKIVQPVDATLHDFLCSNRQSISSLTRIPDLNFFIPDPGSRRSRIRIPDTQKLIQVFFAQKTVSKLSEKWSSMFIPVPDFPPSRIQWSKKHRIPDPDPQHWMKLTYFHNPVDSAAATHPN